MVFELVRYSANYCGECNVISFFSQCFFCGTELWLYCYEISHGFIFHNFCNIMWTNLIAMHIVPRTSTHKPHSCNFWILCACLYASRLNNLQVADFQHSSPIVLFAYIMFASACARTHKCKRDDMGRNEPHTHTHAHSCRMQMLQPCNFNLLKIIIAISLAHRHFKNCNPGKTSVTIINDMSMSYIIFRFCNAFENLFNFRWLWEKQTKRERERGGGETDC